MALRQALGRLVSRVLSVLHMLVLEFVLIDWFVAGVLAFSQTRPSAGLQSDGPWASVNLKIPTARQLKQAARHGLPSRRQNQAT